jgi:hypothetical protein
MERWMLWAREHREDFSALCGRTFSEGAQDIHFLLIVFLISPWED